MKKTNISITMACLGLLFIVACATVSPVHIASENGADINMQDYNGFIPIMGLLSSSSENEILDFVTYLIANGVNVNAMSSKTWIPTGILCAGRMESS